MTTKTRQLKPIKLSCECCRHRDPAASPPLQAANPANFCTTCGLDFSTVRAFDEHWVGEFEPYDRRCLTEDELTDAGWRHDRRGRWRLPADLEPHLVERVVL
jgi:hypothetical protein